MSSQCRVTLIDFTQDAEDVLIFTKNVRLGATPERFAEIKAWPSDKKLAELAYMADTIPSSHEFCHYTFLVEGVSRAATHQIVRTRTGSYAQQSLRVVNACDFDYVPTARNQRDPAAMRLIEDTMKVVKDAYVTLTKTLKQPAEDARGVLPTNIATNIVCGYNLRTLCELAKSRTGGRTQGEYIDVVNAMCDEVLKVHPWAERFLFPASRDHFAEIEAFAEAEFGGDLLRKGRLLKIVDALRKRETQ